MRKNNWYFLDTGSNSGAFNMACDLFLLQSFKDGCIDLPLLRIYSWDQRTYSLGRSQNNGTNLLKKFCSNYPVVKRMTGGQAILHDTKRNELTYSVVVYCEKNFKKLYHEIGKIFIDFLDEYNLDASIGYEDIKYVHDFFCFKTKTRADIVIGDVKVIGSAQYRKNKHVLQHGSVKLDLINKTSRKNISYEDALCVIKSLFELNYNIKFINYGLTKIDYEKINALKNEFLV